MDRSSSIFSPPSIDPEPPPPLLYNIDASLIPKPPLPHTTPLFVDMHNSSPLIASLQKLHRDANLPGFTVSYVLSTVLCVILSSKLNRVNSHLLSLPFSLLLFFPLTFYSTAMPMPMPVPVCLQRCATCGNAMRDFAACKGLRTVANRGKVMQQCSNHNCNSTIFYTNAYPTYDSAVEVARSWNEYYASLAAQALPQPNYITQPVPLAAPPVAVPFVPRSPPSFPTPPLPPLRPAPLLLPLHPAPPLLPAPPYIPPLAQVKGPFTCAGFWCLLKIGKASRGAQNCHFRRCSGCCNKEFEQAEKQNQSRLECPAHNQRKLTASGIPPVLSAPNLPATAPMPNIPVTSPLSEPSPAVVAPAHGSKHLKADAIGPYWNINALNANTVAAVKMSQKAEIRLLKLAQHRSVMPIIWYKKNKQPMCFPVVVESYPNFVLSVKIGF